MRSRSRAALAVLTVGALGLGIASTAQAAPWAAVTPTAHAAVLSASKPRPVIASWPAETIRIDKQDPAPTVVVAGVARGSNVVVRWGDTTIAKKSGTCPVRKATRNPQACALEFTHKYFGLGPQTIQVKSAGRTLGSHRVVVTPAPQPWSAPAGWVQPAGWSVQNGGATYLPCSTVKWYWDSSGEPTNRSGMRASTPEALAILAAETGLTFEETANPADATLTFRWGDFSQYPNAAGTGGGNFRTQTGRVDFNANNWWTSNEWNGFGLVRQPDGRYATGNGWLIVHETMHALGLGHVDDPSEVMNPVLMTTALGAGDKDGLHTMYRNQPCPAP